MKTFIKSHIAIGKSRYDFLKAAGHYPENTVKVKEITPDYEVYYPMLKRVGAPYGWDKRPKYLLEIKKLKQRLLDKNTRLFVASKDGVEIGYCLVTKCEDRGRSLGNVIEIENFGLFPEFTGQRLGRPFLAKIFDELFKNHEHVYLTTRSTNHKGVIPFYKRMGMDVLLAEELPEDVLANSMKKRIEP